MTEPTFLVLRTAKIRQDASGLICLNDIHRAAGFTKNQLPSDWIRLPQAQNAITALIKRVTGKSRDWTKEQIKSAFYVKRGQDAGTWAHENVALSYAEYLSPDLGAEIREIFLRYKKGDETLVGEIHANKAAIAEKERQHHRAVGKAVRLGSGLIDPPYDGRCDANG